MSMKKSEIIKCIAESAFANEEMTKSVLGKAIVDSSISVYNAEPDVKNLKSNLESALYLIDQIEEIDSEIIVMKRDNKNGVFSDSDLKQVEKKRKKFIESLKKCLNEI
jgi:hypothetical protein